jgi:hypothetical protein
MKKYLNFLFIGALLLGVSTMQAQEKTKLTLKASSQVKGDVESDQQTMENGAKTVKTQSKEISKAEYERMLKEARTKEERDAIERKMKAQGRSVKQSKKAQGQSVKKAAHDLNADEKAARKGGGDQKKR